MDQSPSLYIPMDRRQALARNESLPKRTTGTALFADISGFTPLTEALTRTLGPRQGVEELTRQLNRVYDALIAEVDHYHGSVIGFSGDAITCWFDGAGDMGPLRALACAQAMQQAMLAFTAVPVPGGEAVTLAVKTALATGPVRRFLLGDPSINVLEALAGATLVRMSHAEHAANRGEIVADEQTVAELGGRALVTEWRTDGSARFAVLSESRIPAEAVPWPPIVLETLKPEQVRPWLLPAVYERLSEGLGEFLTELRPVVALFLRFAGIDYDGDDQAANKLDAYIRWVQSVVTRYDGTLVDLTIGDKGSYLYVAFGAPVVHEDDAIRAVSAALELRTPPADLSFIEPVQIGISKGIMRTGTSGGSTRRTYSVLGDEVNLAARLMQNATPGHALVSQRVRAATGDSFIWEELPPIQVKGKKDPVPVSRPLRPAELLAETSTFRGAMIGRDEELSNLAIFLQPMFEGNCPGIAYIHGEAGMGKSRLVHELKLQLARRVNWLFCPAEQILRQSLHPFRHCLRQYFGYDTSNTDAQNKLRFDHRLDSLMAALRARQDAMALQAELDRSHSFLGALVGLSWPDSPYERLEPKLRFENTLLAVRALIRAESLRQPVVLHVEDAQWLDADSFHLLNVLSQDAHTYPFVVLVTCRYHDDGSRVSIQVGSDMPTATIDLNQLSPVGLRAMAAQALDGNISDSLSDFLCEKTNGNPFFAEQLALDLRDRGLLHAQDGTWHVEAQELAEVPAGISAVLIARLDRLAARVKAVVQIAAVLGTEFEMRVLSRLLKDDPELLAKVKQAEAEAIWSALSEAQYLFRHTLLRDAAYSMQLQERLRQLHRLVGLVSEELFADNLAPHAAALAYHYGRAGDEGHERHYSRLAGETAAARFANAEAIDHLSRAIDLTPEDDVAERYALLLVREKLYDLQGARQLQAQDIEKLDALADRMNDARKRIEVALRRAPYAEFTGNYADAADAARKAIALSQSIGDVEGEATGYYQLGRAFWRQDQIEARHQSERALTLARSAGLLQIEAKTLLILGNLAYGQGNYSEARAYFDQVLRLRQALGDRQGEAMALNNLGTVAVAQGDYAAAKNYFEPGLDLSREIGDRRNQGIVLSNLGHLAFSQGDYVKGQYFYEQALRLNRETGDRRSENITLNNLSEIAVKSGYYTLARTYNDQALRLSRETEDVENEVFALANLTLILYNQGEYETALPHAQTMLNIARDFDSRSEQAHALMLLGHVTLEAKYLDEAAGAYRQALALQRDLNLANRAMESIAGLARVALARGDLPGAQEQVEAILSHLKTASLDGTDNPFQVYLTCYQVLSACRDDRALSLLSEACSMLRQQAAQLEDESRQEMFLGDVPAHRALMAAWAEQSSATVRKTCPGQDPAAD